ncbi:hypothetical protein Q8A67_023592 [Cirrhinus molitorella]|uniref:Uncharacterized protein n=1 Tax=Cirrhinus molitorella TaxID=172907 RepID=A0AA88P625_9TELE|nr:hypothetical protein Q8A67_023592 [Cirrhinus molitorella]
MWRAAKTLTGITSCGGVRRRCSPIISTQLRREMLSGRSALRRHATPRCFLHGSRETLGDETEERDGRESQQLRGRNGVYDIIAEEHDLSVAHARVCDERAAGMCQRLPWKRLTEHSKLWRCHFSTLWFFTNTTAMNTKPNAL